jgi:2-aminoadipate transaminase
MNVWVSLPEPLDASELAVRAEREGVSYLPGRHFTVSRPQAQGLRLSFAGLRPEKIRTGLSILGKIFAIEFDRLRHAPTDEPAPAMV